MTKVATKPVASEHELLTAGKSLMDLAKEIVDDSTEYRYQCHTNNMDVAPDFIMATVAMNTEAYRRKILSTYFALRRAIVSGEITKEE